jgi:hypothetical protein
VSERDSAPLDFTDSEVDPKLLAGATVQIHGGKDDLAPDLAALENIRERIAQKVVDAFMKGHAAGAAELTDANRLAVVRELWMLHRGRIHMDATLHEYERLIQERSGQ